MHEALTQKEAAERLGISASTLRRRTKEGVAPRNEDGSYPWPEVAAALGEVERLTQKDAAERLGITTRHLRDLTKRGVVTRLEDGSYPWPDVETEHDAFLEEAEERRSAGFGDGSYEQARARKVAAQARLAELEVQQREGELVALADVEAMLAEPLERVNSILQAAPSRHGSQLAKAAGIPLTEARSALADVVEEIRAELREVPDAA